MGSILTLKKIVQGVKVINFEVVILSVAFLRPLTHWFPMHPFSTPPGNIRKTNSFLMFSGDKERVSWEQMG